MTIYKDIHLSFLKPSRDCGHNYSDSSINSSFIVEGDRFLFVNRGNKESIFAIGLWIILTTSEREAICLQTALRPQLVPVRKKESSITCILLRCQRTCFNSLTSAPIRKHQQSDSIPDCSVWIFDLRHSTSGVNHREHTNRTTYQSEASAEARRSLRLCDCQTA